MGKSTINDKTTNQFSKWIRQHAMFGFGEGREQFLAVGRQWISGVLKPWSVWQTEKNKDFIKRLLLVVAMWGPQDI